jgi:hypothetical protein
MERRSHEACREPVVKSEKTKQRNCPTSITRENLIMYYIDGAATLTIKITHGGVCVYRQLIRLSGAQLSSNNFYVARAVN